jgi:transcriptional antiterminator RfaH
MQTDLAAWYCARTKPKHEHIAAANLRKHLQLRVFHPRLQIKRNTRRGVVQVIESLFPSYIFVHCQLGEQQDEIRYCHGISSLVHFGRDIPQVPDGIIRELQACFENQDLLTVEARLVPGDEVTVVTGAFSGMQACVLRNLPARSRVQILLDILGRSTQVEVERNMVVLVRNTLADWAPILAATPPKTGAN